LLSRLRHDLRGVATIELALYAPILALLTIGIVDMSNAFGRKLALEQAAQRAIERVMQTTGDTTVEETIRQEAADQADVPEEQVTVTFQMECNMALQDDYENDVCAVNEDEGRYLIVTVNDVYEPMFPIHFAGYVVSSDPNVPSGYPITAEAGMRTQ
jgi:Flp pilus assembly protein TadG